MHRIFLFCLVGSLVMILVAASVEMPRLGQSDSPAYNHTPKHYIHQSIEDTNAPNVVSAILADYRAFDTLGEMVVLFSSIAAVYTVLAITQKKNSQNHE